MCFLLFGHCEHTFIRKAKGVCLIDSFSEANLPKKVKFSVMKENSGWRFCRRSVTDLITFRFQNRQCVLCPGKTCMKKTHRKELGYYRWMSREASLNVDKLLKYRGKSEVLLTVTWRKPLAKPKVTMSVPMETFLTQVWPDIAQRR